MMFKLKVGDVIHLNEQIPSIYKTDAWKTGYYLVDQIRASFMTHRSDWDKPSVQVYAFKKIKKDGTLWKNFSNGYNALEFDKMFLATGKATVVDKNV